MSALTTHTFGNHREKERKETNKETSTSDQKPNTRQRARSLKEDKSLSV
jgi:hypothetical protein